MSPTSASDRAEAEPLFRLWTVGLALREAGFDRTALEAIDLGGLEGLEAAIAVAVADHLTSVAALVAGDPAAAVARAARLEAAWDRVAAAVDASPPGLAQKSHPFHMRLASRHADFYRAVQARDQGQWLHAARFRGRFILAAAQQALGRTGEALTQALQLSDDWRARISPRLPGLSVIERRSAAWAGQCNRPDLAQLFAGRAASLSDRNAPYGADAPEIWAPPRSFEAVLRFAVAATPVEWAAERKSDVQGNI